ncbi:hypothetical protein KCU87_g10, partial [Aureobasidium melanogenum]
MVDKPPKPTILNALDPDSHNLAIELSSISRYKGSYMFSVEIASFMNGGRNVISPMNHFCLTDSCHCEMALLKRIKEATAVPTVFLFLILPAANTLADTKTRLDHCSLLLSSQTCSLGCTSANPDSQIASQIIETELATVEKRRRQGGMHTRRCRVGWRNDGENLRKGISRPSLDVTIGSVSRAAMMCAARSFLVGQVDEILYISRSLRIGIQGTSKCSIDSHVGKPSSDSIKRGADGMILNHTRDCKHVESSRQSEHRRSRVRSAQQDIQAVSRSCHRRSASQCTLRQQGRVVACEQSPTSISNLPEEDTEVNSLLHETNGRVWQSTGSHQGKEQTVVADLSITTGKLSNSEPTRRRRLSMIILHVTETTSSKKWRGIQTLCTAVSQALRRTSTGEAREGAAVRQIRIDGFCFGCGLKRSRGRRIQRTDHELADETVACALGIDKIVLSRFGHMFLRLVGRL